MGKFFLFLAALLCCANLHLAQTLLEEDFSAGQMPPSNWTTEGTSSHWRIATSANAQGDAPEGRFVWSPAENSTFRLITPIIDLSGVQNLGIGFKHFVDHYAPGYSIGMAMRVDGGDWISIWGITPTSNVGPQQVWLSVSENLGSVNTELCWYYIGDTYNIDYWYFDDIVIFVPYQFDVACSSIELDPQVNIGEQAEATAQIRNLGLNSATFDVKCEYYLGNTKLAESNVNIIDLAPFESAEAVFAPFEPAQADELYRCVVTTQLANDESAANDSAEKYFTTNSNDRIVLWEQFTNWSCGYCPPADAALDATFDELGYSQIIPVAYHVWWPGDNDAFFNANQDDSEARTSDYYGVSGVPAGFADGSTSSSSSSSVIYWKVNSRRELKTGVAITPAVTTLGNRIQFDIDIDVPGGVIPGDYKLHCVVTESHFGYAQAPGGNGVRSFDFVMRKMYPDAAGTSIQITKGDNLSLTIEGDMSLDWIKDNLTYVVFIQDDITKEVIQATTIENITGIEEDNELPLSYALSQNYPNPFNPETRINYQIPEAGVVTIKIFDILGREVKVIKNEFKEAGNHFVNFNAADLTSGIYFYELSCNDFMSIKKMILMK
ncbi:Omp28-related outer membrane protein [Bacteroidota bacterium]